MRSSCRVALVVSLLLGCTGLLNRARCTPDLEVWLERKTQVIQGQEGGTVQAYVYLYWGGGTPNYTVYHTYDGRTTESSGSGGSYQIASASMPYTGDQAPDGLVAMVECLLDKRLCDGKLTGSYTVEDSSTPMQSGSVDVNAGEDECGCTSGDFHGTATPGPPPGSGSGGCPSCGSEKFSMAESHHAKPSYSSWHSEEDSMTGYGWVDGWDLRLKLLDVSQTDNNARILEVNLGGSRIYLTRLYDGSYISGTKGADITVREFTDGDDPKISVRFGTSVIYTFPNFVFTGGSPAEPGDEERAESVMKIVRQTGTYDYEGLTTTITLHQSGYGAGKPQYITDAQGKKLQYTYNSNGKLYQVKDHNGNVLETLAYSSDGSGGWRLSSFTDAEGDETTYVYSTENNLEHKLQEIHYPGGQKLFYTIDHVGDYTDDLGIIHRLTAYESSKLGNGEDPEYLEREVSRTNVVDQNAWLLPQSSYDLVKTRYGDSTWSETKKYDLYLDSSVSPKVYKRKAVTNPDGLGDVTTSYEYDYDDMHVVKTQVTGPGNYYLTTRYEYDTERRLTSVTTRKDSSIGSGETPDVRYEYDGWDHITKVKDALNHETRYEYFTYSGYLTNLLKYTWAEYNGTQKNKIEYEYFLPGDGQNHNFLLKQTKEPSSGSVLSSYDYVYDASNKYFNGEVKSVTDAAGNTTEYSYSVDGTGKPTVTTTVPANSGTRSTVVNYDKLRRVKTISYPPAQAGGSNTYKVEYSYNSNGNVSNMTYSFGGTNTRIVNYYYDSETGWLYQVKDERDSYEDTVTTYTYYHDGSVKTIESEDNSKVEYEYDALGRAKKVKYYVDASNTNDYSYSYYPDGSLKTVTWPNDLGVTYEYNAQNSSSKYLNLLSKIDYPDGDMLDTKVDTTLTYFDNGALKTVKVASNEAITYTYDDYGRPTSEDGALTGTVDKTWFTSYYDSGYNKGMLYQFKYPGESTAISLTYDELNRLTKITDHNSKTTRFGYNSLGSLARVELPNGTSANYTYDDLDRVLTLANLSGATGIGSFTYDYSNKCACSMGQISRILFDNGRSVEYDYNKLGWLKKEDYKNAGLSSTNKYEYTYDGDGNRLTKKYDGSDSKVVNYATARDATSPSFNESNQLGRVWTPGSNTVGNKINVSGTLAEENVDRVEVTPYWDQTAGTTVTAEVREALFVSRNVAFSNDGDRSDYKVKAVAYDKVGHTSAQVEKTGVKLDKHLDIKFWFKDDDQGNRGDKLGDVVMKQQTFTYTSGGGSGTETTRYYYNQARMLEYIDLAESDQDLQFTYDGLGRRVMVRRGNIGTIYQGKVLTFTAVETKKYVYLGGSVIRELNGSDQVVKEYMRGLGLGGGIGSIIYQKKSSDYYYYHYNHKGDVVALTDGNAKLAAYYEYDAWGNVMTEAEKTGVDNPYRYSTKEWDEKSGLYYFGARYYCPEIGRWTQRDPAGTVDGLNVYLYAGNDAVSRVDPWGNQFEWDLDDIGVYEYRSGPGWLIEIFPFFSTNMCHYWIDIKPTTSRADTNGFRTVKQFTYTGKYKPSAKWPVYWEKSEDRRNASTGDRCDCTNAAGIYKCIEDVTNAYTGDSCVRLAWVIHKKCCLTRWDAIYDNPLARPIGWPEWPGKALKNVTRLPPYISAPSVRPLALW